MSGVGNVYYVEDSAHPLPHPRLGALKAEAGTRSSLGIHEQHESNHNVRGHGVASRLCASIFDFWSLILRQESWPLTSPDSRDALGPLSSPSSCGDWDEQGLDPDSIATDETEAIHDYESSSPFDAEMTICSPEPMPNQEDMEVTCHPKNSWDMERFVLNEERQRLCLWKFRFSDEDLNRLTSDDSSLLGSAVLESLVNIAYALVGEADLHQNGPDGSSDELQKMIRIHAAKLKTLVQEGKGLVRNAYQEDDAETINTGRTENTVPDDIHYSLREKVKCDINRLQRLRLPIDQALDIMTG